MFVADWMTRDVVTVGPEDSIAHAMHLMGDKGIKHLPVMKDGRLVGVLSDRDIRAYSPSKATALDVFEIHYLLARATVKEAMRRQPTTTGPDAPIETAALTMLERDIGCLPVLEGDTLVGIISDRDIFRALVDISGARHGGLRICVTLEDRPGSIREFADLVRAHGFHLVSILTSYEGAPAGSRVVVLRTDEAGDPAGLKAALEKAYGTVKMQGPGSAGGI